jgi:hypothetical protein
MEPGGDKMSAPAKWIFRFERLINPSAFSLFFAEGRCLIGITSGSQVVIREFESDREAREAVVHLLAAIESQYENGNKPVKNNPAA